MNYFILLHSWGHWNKHLAEIFIFQALTNSFAKRVEDLLNIVCVK